MSILDHKKIGMRIKALRKSLGMSQQKFAEQCGVVNTAISNWETAAQGLSAEGAVRICNSFDVTLDYLFRGRVGSLAEETRTSVLRELNKLEKSVNNSSSSN